MSMMDRYAFRLGLILVVLATLAGLFAIFYNRWQLYHPITLTPETARDLTTRLASLDLPTLGGEDGVAVVAFYSYTCPACRQHTRKYEQMLIRKLAERGWGYQLAPVAIDPRAVRPSALALCTWEQAPSNFEALHEALFAGETLPPLPAGVEDCAASEATQKKLEAIQKAAVNAGAVGTPSFYLVSLKQTITGVQNEERWRGWLEEMDRGREGRR